MAISNRARIANLVASVEPSIRDAFIAAVDDLREGADLSAIVAALERRDIQAAIDAMHLDAAAFDALDRAISEAYRAAGVETVAGFPTIRTPSGARATIRFDARNLQAESFLRSHSSTLITAIVADQREAIRAALAAGMEAGRGPRAVALDIVGRMDRSTGKRVGGLIGLTTAQEAFARAALTELLSGDPAQMKAYLQRTRRDKRFDATVLKAIQDEKPVGATDAARMVQRYKDRLLELRGTTIGRTEAQTSVYAARHEAFRQAVERGEIQEAQITRTWVSAGDVRVRDTHNVLHGQRIKGLATRFVSPSGARLLYPHDTAAPAGETVNCRCDVSYRIDVAQGLR